jgi:hypothetical protein
MHDVIFSNSRKMRLLVFALALGMAIVGLHFGYPRRHWFMAHEPVASWLESVAACFEAIALILLFGLDLSEAKTNRQQLAAAMLSAQAAINTERPWLVVTWRSDTETPGLFRFGCRNQGNTPAKVVSVSAVLRIVNRLDDLKIPPDYSHPAAAPDLNIIVRHDSFPIAQGVNAGAYLQKEGKTDSINNSTEFLVYYGNVVYRDTLYPESSSEGLHQTTWCFVYQPSGERKFVRSGPEEYNRYT